MSAKNHMLESTLATRGMFARPGVKKDVKALQSRAARRANSMALSAEVHALVNSELSAAEKRHQFSEWNLDELATHFLAAHAEKADDFHFGAEALTDADEDAPHIPLHLQGSLPDWMLDQMEAAKGNAFDELSLFEAKKASPTANFGVSTMDEALFA